MTKVGFVDDVGRGAEFIGDFGQRHPADTESTELIDVGGQWPYRPVYSGRGALRSDGKISKRVIEPPCPHRRSIGHCLRAAPFRQLSLSASISTGVAQQRYSWRSLRSLGARLGGTRGRMSWPT